jgi:hypothetical protein
MALAFSQVLLVNLWRAPQAYQATEWKAGVFHGT